ncbi:DUF3896 family protein [Neobacillus muris]|uniref:DUF3896 family protein n=1 Tax=Neobacillus muris TaxID=2941334 RepID=UPI0024082A4A|nr:DUF3896 family protein [Neobacillus muris]
MEYQEVKKVLEGMKLDLLQKLEDPSLSLDEKVNIKKTIYNYEYIIELTEMNHYERGFEVL